MADWEREYARLRAQQSVGVAVNVMVQLHPYPEVILICRACDEYLCMNFEDRVWACDCGAAEMNDAEIKTILEDAAKVLHSKSDRNVSDAVIEKDDWLKKVWKTFRS